MNQPSKQREKIMAELRSISHLFDEALPIPGTPYRIGIDPLLGLLPAVGDYLGAIVSGYIVVQAARMGASKQTLSRMVGNIIWDAFVGTVPLFGDVVDVAWKANTKNIKLLEKHLSEPHRAQKTDWWFLGFLLAGLALVIFIISAIGFWILRAFFHSFN
ncbi:DUF4112 domain-containing protein [Lusitaniella coriacea]|uniref:DUF4112 domain-containing protein n=1 Tax=Lusitaniella coriacea TaxID=1983105 RepID=UPI003CF9FD0B